MFFQKILKKFNILNQKTNRKIKWYIFTYLCVSIINDWYSFDMDIIKYNVLKKWTDWVQMIQWYTKNIKIYTKQIWN